MRRSLQGSLRSSRVLSWSDSPPAKHSAKLSEYVTEAQVLPVRKILEGMVRLRRVRLRNALREKPVSLLVLPGQVETERNKD